MGVPMSPKEVTTEIQELMSKLKEHSYKGLLAGARPVRIQFPEIKNEFSVIGVDYDTDNDTIILKCE